MTRTAAIAIVALAASLAAQNPQQAPVFRAGASAVEVDVSVRDSSRRTLADLTAADFTVLDNGVAQQVDDVSFGKLPIDVTVGLDISGSVGGPLLDRLRVAIRQLMGDLKKEDRLKLMVFNMRFSQTIDFTTDVAQIDRAVRSAGAIGGTALYDALSVAMITAAEPGRRQLIVFFTDGNDTSSTTSPATLLKVAERTRATVSLVLLPTVSTLGRDRVETSASAPYSTAYTNLPGLAGLPPNSSVTYVDSALNKLASDTGGVVLSTSDGSSLGPTFLQVLDRFRSAYVLFYSPKGVDRGGFHTLTVTVKRPGAVIEARRGYFGG